MGARRLDPWVHREIDEAINQAVDWGLPVEVAAVYYSPEVREQIRQAVLREGRRRGLILTTRARGETGQVVVSVDLNALVRGSGFSG